MKERDKAIQEFIARALALKVGDEYFQCYIADFPTIEELRELLKNEASTVKFKVWQTINGTIVQREE